MGGAHFVRHFKVMVLEVRATLANTISASAVKGGRHRLLQGTVVPILLLLLCGKSFGQAAPNAAPPPNAGQLDQDLRAAQPKVEPGAKASPLPEIAPNYPEYGAGMAPGEHVQLKGVNFYGNTVFSTAQLAKLLPHTHPGGETLEDLNAIRDAITNFYRNHGYPLARAMFLAQKSNNGYLTLTIVEGRIGHVDIVNKSRLPTEVAERIIQNNLCPSGSCQNGLITDEGLQRSTLLLSDEPALVVQSGLSRGNDFGTADLTVSVNDSHAPGDGMFVVTGGADNFGSSSTGGSARHDRSDRQ